MTIAFILKMLFATFMVGMATGAAFAIVKNFFDNLN